LCRKQSFQPWRKSESRFRVTALLQLRFADWHSTDCCPYSANTRFDPKALARPRIARTGFWLSLFRFQGTTGTHPRGVGAGARVEGSNPSTWDRSW
jgi:hypothetical protein